MIVFNNINTYRHFSHNQILSKFYMISNILKLITTIIIYVKTNYDYHNLLEIENTKCYTIASGEENERIRISF